METRTGSVHFGRLKGSGPRTISETVHFPREVEKAIAGLIGYSAGFRGDDHHLGLINIRLNTEIDGDSVRVQVTFGLRDWSGTWDDDYEGTIQYVVLADLEGAMRLPPRADLAITGMEINQAIQYFRSAQHLDGPNIMPDNSIRLIARKDTGVRVYVDYDRDAGLPPIAALSGELEVSTSIGSTSFMLYPINPIAPRRDSEIDRAIADHTLNFMIPEVWCQGELTVRCRVFDVADAANRSRMFQRTLRFEEREPLRVFGVGVHYTGQGLDLVAPLQGNILNTLSFVEKTYPVPEVLMTGYSTIDFDKDMKADIDDGCGNGFEDLLDVLRDMRGSSTDVYYAVLPLGGIDSGNVGGCGGGGVGAGFVTVGTTAAHEIGHALGLDHAPCDDPARCRNPSNPDGDYPEYASYPSDSIGEFGYDPANNTVFDPASIYDFMGYSPHTRRWVSLYTYKKLMSHFPSTSGLTAFSSAMLRASTGRIGVLATTIIIPTLPLRQEGEALRVPMMKLFLRLSIDRERKVTRGYSFHFPAIYSGVRKHQTDFAVELRDENGKVLSCHPLYQDCPHFSADCWPKRTRQVIPFPADARILLVFEGDTSIYKEVIPDPPVIRLESEHIENGDIRLSWAAADEEEELWYLIQWEDRRNVWRGLGPRTHKTEAIVPFQLLRDRKQLTIRVLASSGIATGIAETVLEAHKPEPINEVEVVLVDGPTHDSKNTKIPPVLKVAVLQGTGQTVADSDIVWFSDGCEVGRGRSFDLRGLSVGQHVLNTVVLDTGNGQAECPWLVERTEDARFKLLGRGPTETAKRKSISDSDDEKHCK